MLGPTPLVSVVIPTYNRAPIVCDALESVRRQTYRPIEVIVVDDGSTDGTEALTRDWQAKHATEDGFISRYVSQKNQGGNVARNRGIAQCTGDYVAFLDSDDCWLPEKLAKQMRVLLTNDDDMGAVYCGLCHVELATGEVLETPRRSFPTGRLLDQLLVRDVTAPTSAYLIRRGVFRHVGIFDTELQARQDWDMWIRIASKYRIGAVPEALVEYREHSGERTRTDPQKEINAYQRILAKYASLRLGLSLSTRRSVKAAYYRRMGRVYYHHGISTRKAIGFHAKSILTWPCDFDSYSAFVGIFLPSRVRRAMHQRWNHIFGATRFSIRSH